MDSPVFGDKQAFQPAAQSYDADVDKKRISAIMQAGVISEADLLQCVAQRIEQEKTKELSQHWIFKQSMANALAQALHLIEGDF